MQSKRVGTAVFAIVCCHTVTLWAQAPDVEKNIFVFTSAAITGDQDHVSGNPNQLIVSTRNLDKSISFVGSRGSNSGRASASGFAALGQLGVIARANGTAADLLQVNALATAIAVDELTWFSNGHSKLTITIPIHLSGTIKATAGGFGAGTRASYRAVAQITNEFGIFSTVKENVALSFPTNTEITPGDTSLVAIVQAGRPVEFSLYVEGRARFEGQNTCNNPSACDVFATGSGTATAEFGNTLAWGGIESVVDTVTGELVTDWTVTSRSGADYSKSFVVVPEPATWLLLVIAVVGWGRRRRRYH
jgi:hypothetical protein